MQELKRPNQIILLQPRFCNNLKQQIHLTNLILLRGPSGSFIDYLHLVPAYPENIILQVRNIPCISHIIKKCCRCGLGRRFSDDGGTTQTEFLNYTCPESGIWSPGPIDLQPCVWVACIDAPLPPNGTYLTNLQVIS